MLTYCVCINEIIRLVSGEQSDIHFTETSKGGHQNKLDERMSEICSSQRDQLPVGFCGSVGRSQRSWVRIPLKPEYFSGFNFTVA